MKKIANINILSSIIGWEYREKFLDSLLLLRNWRVMGKGEERFTSLPPGVIWLNRKVSLFEEMGSKIQLTFLSDDINRTEKHACVEKTREIKGQFLKREREREREREGKKKKKKKEKVKTEKWRGYKFIGKFFYKGIFLPR